MEWKPVSVTQLNKYIEKVLTGDPILSDFSVVGEVSRVTYHKSGHVYFTLADAESTINCFLPQSIAQRLGFRIKDGSAVTIRGRISLYVRGGRYSIFVLNVEENGKGSLAEAFERTKAKLAAEGLFDPARKRAIPAFPKKVGIVTSDTGAAVRDILKNITGRNNLVDVVIFPTLVQGEYAPESIVRSIQTANTDCPDLDVLIVGRGGGSAEDLAAFNDEQVARAVAGSAIPVISAVGHEIDFTICDMAADVRAETPTKAGVIAVPDVQELRERIDDAMRLISRSLENDFRYYDAQTKALRDSMDETVGRRLENALRDLEYQKTILTQNDPRAVLKRGYAAVRDADGRTISGASQLRPGQDIFVRFRDGEAGAAVKEIRTGGSDEQ